MKVAELKKLCDDFELPKDGTKAELINRLQKVAAKLPLTPGRRPRSDPGLLSQVKRGPAAPPPTSREATAAAPALSLGDRRRARSLSAPPDRRLKPSLAQTWALGSPDPAPALTLR
eukprot:4651323-Prymnesium_polylepis.1